jgi:hypothetical protein
MAVSAMARLAAPPRRAPYRPEVPTATPVLRRCGSRLCPPDGCGHAEDRPALRRASVVAEPATIPASVAATLHSPGRPLDPATQGAMAERFGHDFSQVRVHTDPLAAASASATSADAYTVGRHVVFGAGRYRPGTEEGRRLLVHELTHVLQQRAAEPGPLGALEVGRADDPSEAEARRNAVAQGDGEARGRHQVVRPRVQRQEEPDSLSDPLGFARSLERRFPGWRNVLPDCPCTEAEAKADPSAWQGGPAGILLPFFHPGAAFEYRSARGFTSIPGTSHGQQCCYDLNGRLITEGPGAGTPDLWSPRTHFLKHQRDDVQTWASLGWQLYNRYWIPNQGRGCRANRGAVREPARCQPKYLGFGDYLGEDCIVRPIGPKF